MKCKTCRYFVELREDNHMFILDGDGICKRYPQSIPVTVDYWCGEHKAKPAKKKEPAHNVQEVIAYYCETYKDAFQINPQITGKDSSAATRMLKEHTVAEVNKVIADYFTDSNWHTDNGMYGLIHVEKEWPKMTVKKVKIDIETADDFTYEAMLNEQAINYGNHDQWPDYKQFVLDTHELMTFEEFIAEYHGSD